MRHTIETYRLKVERWSADWTDKVNAILGDSRSKLKTKSNLLKKRLPIYTRSRVRRRKFKTDIWESEQDRNREQLSSRQ